MRTVLRLLFLFTCSLPLDAFFGLSSVFKYSEVENSMKHHSVCKSLGLRGRQLKNCNSSLNVSRALTKALRMSRRECAHLFRFDRWKCDYNENYRIRLIKKDFKESAFLFALSAASLVHSVARACSKKAFSKRCNCYEPPSPNRRRMNILNGICGDNLPFAVKYVKRFLQLQQHAHSDVIKHNVKVGIKAVVDSNITRIECPPIVYGQQSCPDDQKLVKLKLAPFRTVSKLLKRYYKRAVMVTNNNKKGVGLEHISDTRLVFGSKSPDFCTRSQFSPGVKGRICKKDEK
uniref:Protein Wnt n=1 Tax=Strigamia maritima TaxID=126957 RepID=T1JL28_STRMM